MPAKSELSSDASRRLFRFRPVASLLGRGELRELKIFFSAPNQLNDPLEGYKDIVWEGDAIVWRNHIRHYLMCLMFTTIMTSLGGSDYDATQDDFNFNTEIGLATPELKATYRAICDTVFAVPEVAAYPALLERRGKIRREEWLYYLRSLHGVALRAVLNALARPSGMAPALSVLASLAPWAGAPLLSADDFRDLAEALGAEVGQPDAESRFFAARNTVHQCTEVAPKDDSKAIKGLTARFPEVYIARLPGLMFSHWYAACFTSSWRQASLWGGYGDGHRGVCLEYRVSTNDAGVTSMPIHRVIGGGSSGPIWAFADQRFYPVGYRPTYFPIDFFSSLGRLTSAQLFAGWLTDLEGRISSKAAELQFEQEGWVKAFWDRHYEALTVKLPGWAHEGEERLVLDGLLNDFSDPSTRALAYRFDSLVSLTFGIATAAADKAEIVRLLKAKCQAHGRTDFELYQAVFSPSTGDIDRVLIRMDLKAQELK